MKNDDILTGMALVGLAFAAYQFMKPSAARAAAAPTTGTLRPIANSGGKLPAWASLAANLGDLGNTLYGGSAAARGTVQGIFAPGAAWRAVFISTRTGPRRTGPAAYL